ncbi:MAG: hypothetical protein Tsb0018_05370 [Opitutales bacterium]|tara:strand:+ start:6315 stop:7241 length:927 start_codon:yes stop_codon:yes gene_type:complete
MKTTHLIAFLTGLFLATTGLVAQPFLYWTDRSGGLIQRSDLDGSNVTTIVSGIATPEAMTYDSVNNKIYWLERGTGSISRADIDGSNIESVISSLGSGLRNIAVDPTNSHVYWAIDSAGPSQVIRRANYDGTGTTTILSGLNDPQSIALDVPNNFLYYSDEGSNAIFRSTLAGAGLTSIFSTNTNDPERVVLNDSGTFAYWVDGNAGGGTNSIYRGDLSDFSQTTLVTGLINPSDIAVTDSTIYISSFFAGQILSAPIGGGSTTTLVTGLGQLRSVTVIPEPSTYALIFSTGVFIAVFYLRCRRKAVK